VPRLRPACARRPRARRGVFRLRHRARTAHRPRGGGLTARALVSGALAVKAGNGGNAWTRLSFVRGLERLGFEVCFVEQLERPSAESLAYFDLVRRQFDLRGALVTESGSVGLDRDDLLAFAADSELLLNIGGHLTLEPLRSAPRVKVYLDDDPGYTQLWHSTGALGDRLTAHDAWFTVGASVGRAGCAIPTGGIPWRAIRPPVVLDDWPVAVGGDSGRFTTVASWRGAYGRLEHEGRLFGQKAHEFRRLAELPRRTGAVLEIALDIHTSDDADRELLLSHGWRLVDPRAVAFDPLGFRRYVQASGAEVSAAQGIYVETASGWFSDRTVRYLASGKPVLVQDTGFGADLPVGEGLLAFATLDDAAAGIESILGDYDRHARAARALAEAYFDSDVVVARLLDEAGVGA
jgi:hypothetical protein